MTTHKTKERIGTVFDLTNVKEALKKERQKGIKQGEKQGREKIIKLLMEELTLEDGMTSAWRRINFDKLKQQITSPIKEKTE